MNSTEQDKDLTGRLGVTRIHGLLVFTRTPQGYNMRLGAQCADTPGAVVLRLHGGTVECLPQSAEQLRPLLDLIPGADLQTVICMLRHAPELSADALDRDYRSDMLREHERLLLRPCGSCIEVLLDGRTLLGILTRRGGQRRGGCTKEEDAQWRRLQRRLRDDEEFFRFAMEPLGLRGSCGGWDFELSARGLHVMQAGETQLVCTLHRQRLADGCHPACTLAEARTAPLSPAAARFAEALYQDERLREFLALPAVPRAAGGRHGAPAAAAGVIPPDDMPDAVPAEGSGGKMICIMPDMVDAAAAAAPQLPAETVLRPVSGRVQELVAQLDEAVIGQQQAKEALAAACYVQELSLLTQERIQPRPLLLQGPTGCGKTSLVSRLAALGGHPCVRIDITGFTNAGYTGRDLTEIFDELLDSAMRLDTSLLPAPLTEDESLLSRQVRACERSGIVFIDELDKLCSKGNEYQDAYLLGMQHELLNLISGSRVKLPNHTAGTDKQPVMMDTARMLFVCAGVFENRSPDELCAELRGRLGQPVHMRGLTRADFMTILSHEHCSPLRPLRSLARAAGREITITDEAMAELADLADARRHLGARALNDMVAQLQTAVLSGRLPGQRIGAAEVRACVRGGGSAECGPALPVPAAPEAADVIAHLSRQVHGQQQAKQALATAYVTRLLHPQDARRGSYSPQHVLLQGPTGCGKTSLVRSLADFGVCPLACADLSGFTPAGMAGSGLSIILDDLYDQALELVRRSASDLPPDVMALDTERQSAVRLCERYGIIFLDEFDKLCADGGTGSGLRLQYELLNFIEGRSQPLERHHGLSLDTARMLFICAGAFESCSIDDLCSELRGRLVHRATLQALGYEDYLAILTGVCGSPLDELQERLRAARHPITLERSAVEQIAHLAEQDGRSGGRALRRICACLQRAVLCGQLRESRLNAALVAQALSDPALQDAAATDKRAIGFVRSR